jgi:hypothetical protein
VLIRTRLTRTSPSQLLGDLAEGGITAPRARLVHRDPERLGECPRDRADELALALTVCEEPGGGDVGNLKARVQVALSDSHFNLVVYRATNAPVIFISRMRSTVAALWSIGDNVASTCDARRRGSQNSKSSLSDLSYSYEWRGDVMR